jgi:hypothetical protein
MAKAKRNGKKRSWTKREDRLIFKRGYSAKELAEMTGRTEPAIYQRRTVLRMKVAA